MPACPMGEKCCQNETSEVELLLSFFYLLNVLVQLRLCLTLSLAFTI